MNRKNCKIDIGVLLSTVNPSDQLYARLSLVLSSLDKRAKFAHLYYHELEKCFADGMVGLERYGLEFTSSGNIYPNRTYYEAHIYAFAQNLHAVCDSFPYVVFLMLQPLSYRTANDKLKVIDARCGWSSELLSAVAETLPKQKKLYHRLKRFMNDKDFLILKGLVNQSKHQHLVRIQNNYTTLNFEEIEYYDKAVKGEKKKLMNQDVKLLMRKWSNKLFPKLFILFWTLYEARVEMQSPKPNTE